ATSAPTLAALDAEQVAVAGVELDVQLFAVAGSAELEADGPHPVAVAQVRAAQGANVAMLATDLVSDADRCRLADHLAGGRRRKQVRECPRHLLAGGAPRRRPQPAAHGAEGE